MKLKNVSGCDRIISLPYGAVPFKDQEIKDITFSGKTVPAGFELVVDAPPPAPVPASVAEPVVQDTKAPVAPVIEAKPRKRPGPKPKQIV